MNELSFIELQKKLGYNFLDSSLLVQALSHKSAKLKFDNERLEFLGDAALSLVTAEFLFLNKTLKEGELSKLRAKYVCKKNLSIKANDLGLFKYLIAEKTIKNSGTIFSCAVMADTLEAIFGAVFVDSGLENTRKVILKVMGEPSFVLEEDFKDYKTRLQELLQKNGQKTPIYSVVSITGPGHAPVFTVNAVSDGSVLGKGQAETKKSAEQDAAKIALKKLEHA